MNPTALIINAAAFVLSTSVSTVVTHAIKAGAPIAPTLIQKVSFGVGALALGSVAGDQATRYAVKQYTATVREFAQVKALFNKKS